MFILKPEFERFLAVWRSLPRDSHPLLPAKRDVTPAVFGDFLRRMAMTEMRAPQNLLIFFAGSEFEHNAGLDITGRNYYDLLPPAFFKPMTTFHENLLGTPCGACIADVIVTSSGARYLHETIQLPLTDGMGTVRYLMGYGLARKPAGDDGYRVQASHQPGNIKELHYLDLGAGAPGERIEDFTFYR
ncbi:MAG: PAS domain-containing protein [Alphaproteobacteria bacterium]|nr:MAG: PAS domain-containing protein [Alphaproteobacteria bacterium]